MALSHQCSDPKGVPWIVLREAPMGQPWALMGRVLMAPPGPSWAGPLWAPMSIYIHIHTYIRWQRC